MGVQGLAEVPTGSRRGLLDRFARAVAPGLVARRARARLEIRQHEVRARAIEELEKTFALGGYAGASKTRGQATWAPGGGSADADVLGGLHDLRERSRDLIRNDPHAAGMIDIWTANIVGHGMTPQSRLDFEELGISKEQAGKFQRTAEKLFLRWAKTADFLGLQSFADQQEMILRGVFESGDIFCVPRRVPFRRYGLALELIEADRVTTPPRLQMRPDVREGVVIGSSGEPVAYWVKKTHPGDVLATGAMNSDDFVRVPLFDEGTGRQLIHHFFRPLRPGQSRGVPMLSPALSMFRDLTQYMKAELIGAKVAACYALFIVTPDPFGDAARATTKTVNNQQHELLEPGMIRRLAAGEDIKGFEPNRPASNFVATVKAYLRAIGTSLMTPLELVSMDFSETNYTSGRMALTEVRRSYKKVQKWLAEKFCQPIWERILTEAVLLGDLEAPDFFERIDDWCRCIWVGPGWQWVDPSKEVTATIESMKGNLTTLADECSSRGLDWEDVLAQRAREVEVAKELGLDFGMVEERPPAPVLPGEDPEEAPAGAGRSNEDN